VSSSKSAAYLWYPRDFTVDEHVVLMDLETEGAYRRLLDHQWLHGSVPSDIAALAKICKNSGKKRMERMWDTIAPCFEADPADQSRLVNRRLERERANVEDFRANRAEAGRRGGLATQERRRADGQQESSTASSNGQAVLKQPSPSTTPSPSTSVVGRKHQPTDLPYLTRCVVALNAGLRANPALPGFREVAASEQAGRVTWEDDGIPVETAERVVAEVAATYKPTPHNRQPGSLRYFDKAVRRAHELASQPKGAAPPSANPFDAVIAKLDQEDARAAG